MLSLKDPSLAARLRRRQAHSLQQVLIEFPLLLQFHLTFRHHDMMDSLLLSQTKSAL